MPRAYYNEIDPFAAEWLRWLIAEGLIAEGDVDTRSIEDVHPHELADYTQHHFFAGIGVWSYALRNTGWPDDRPVWTGSCPCQPFSQAGKGGGFADERHLWPAWNHLIGECQPAVVFGEQVASKDGLAWFDLVSADMEAKDYTGGALDLCVAGFGGPHIRQRLFYLWLRQSESQQQYGLGNERRGRREPSDPGLTSGLRIASSSRSGWDTGALPGKESPRWPDGRQPDQSQSSEPPGGPPNNNNQGLAFGSLDDDGRRALRFEGSAFGADEPVRGFWSGADWLWYRDGRYRPVEVGTFPLAPSTPGRVGSLRGYGNAINAEVARHFIEAAIACLGPG